MELSNEQPCLKVEGLIFDLCRFLKNIITFFYNKCLMYVLRLILKSDGKSWAAYKVFKYNFYIGSVKKKIIVFKEKKKRDILSTNMASLFCHLFANQKSNPSCLHMKRDLFIVWI